MMKLMKYELLRRKNLLLGALISIVIVEGLTVFAISRGGGWHILATFLTVLLGVCVMLLPILNTITKLYADLKHKQGYMLFLTPQSGRRIVWAKTLYGTLETFAAIALVFGCLALSVFAVDLFHESATSGLIQDMTQQLGQFASGTAIFGYGLLLALQMLAQLSIAILAVTVSRAIMPSSSYNWLIALLLYFAFAFGVNIVNVLVLLAFGFAGDVMRLTADAAMSVNAVTVKYLAVGAVTYVAWYIGCTTLSARLVQNKVDL